MKVINPATGRVVRDYEPHSESEVQSRLAQAERAFDPWRSTSFERRATILSEVAEVLRGNQSALAGLITEEMGKPVREAEAEVRKCARCCDFYAREAARFLGKRQADTADDARAYVRYDPLGPVLGIMPWNFPFWQLFRFAAPALMAGNTVLLKHATNVPGCALAIERLFLDAGLPPGTMTTLLISSDRVAEVIESDVVRAVTLTGSEMAGQSVAATAGRQLKKTVLELGGSDPFLVLSDAEIGLAAEQAVKARTMNSGQSCIAAKRFLVEQPVLEEFTQAFVRRMRGLRVGDPRDRETDVGPLARQDLRDTLHEQVQKSVQAGARILIGGEPQAGDGYFYQPTVLGDVRPGMAVFDQETFGPVAAIIPVPDEAAAIQLANRSRYGLGASIWTRDAERAERMAADLEAGNVFINEIVKSDPRVPFGGVKRSGYGRELSDFGIREFTNVKTVWVQRLDVVQEASEESFPASDPPSWSPTISQ